jgi:hypothetical protein
LGVHPAPTARTGGDPDDPWVTEYRIVPLTPDHQHFVEIRETDPTAPFQAEIRDSLAIGWMLKAFGPMLAQLGIRPISQTSRSQGPGRKGTARHNASRAIAVLALLTIGGQAMAPATGKAQQTMQARQGQKGRPEGSPVQTAPRVQPGPTITYCGNPIGCPNGPQQWRGAPTIDPRQRGWLPNGYSACWAETFAGQPLYVGPTTTIAPPVISGPASPRVLPGSQKYPGAYPPPYPPLSANGP